jgi:hypothetical protein
MSEEKYFATLNLENVLGDWNVYEKVSLNDIVEHYHDSSIRIFNQDGYIFVGFEDNLTYRWTLAVRLNEGIELIKFLSNAHKRLAEIGGTRPEYMISHDMPQWIINELAAEGILPGHYATFHRYNQHAFQTKTDHHAPYRHQERCDCIIL